MPAFTPRVKPIPEPRSLSDQQHSTHYTTQQQQFELETQSHPWKKKTTTPTSQLWRTNKNQRGERSQRVLQARTWTIALARLNSIKGLAGALHGGAERLEASPRAKTIRLSFGTRSALNRPLCTCFPRGPSGLACCPWAELSVSGWWTSLGGGGAQLEVCFTVVWVLGVLGQPC